MAAECILLNDARIADADEKDLDYEGCGEIEMTHPRHLVYQNNFYESSLGRWVDLLANLQQHQQ